MSHEKIPQYITKRMTLIAVGVATPLSLIAMYAKPSEHWLSPVKEWVVGDEDAAHFSVLHSDLDGSVFMDFKQPGGTSVLQFSLLAGHSPSISLMNPENGKSAISIDAQGLGNTPRITFYDPQTGGVVSRLTAEGFVQLRPSGSAEDNTEPAGSE